MNNLDAVRQLKKIIFRLYDKNLTDNQKIELLTEYDRLNELFDKEFDLDKGFKEYDKYRGRIYRVRTKILSIMIIGACSFLTLTFTDEVLANTTEETRRRYVSRFLKSKCTDYVANIDYGKINGREHYHAVVNGINIDMSDWDKYGYSHCVSVGRKDDQTTASKISKYLYKLSNHATKDTTQCKKIIYSRDK